MNATKKMPKYIWAAVVLAIAGIGTWIYQIVSGMQVTGLDNNVVWGLYIAAFYTAVGGGAALLAIVGISEYKNNISPSVKSRMLIISITTFIVAGILVSMDTGNILQVYRLITSFNFQSMVVWDFWLLALCFLVAILFLLRVRKGGKGGKIFGAVAISLSLILVVIEAFLHSSATAHAMWGSGMIVLSFLLSAAIGGFSLTLMITPKDKFIHKMLLSVLVLSLIVTLADVFTGVLTGNPETKSEMMFVISGGGAPFFWGQLTIGLLLPLYLLIKGSQPTVAALLAVVGVVFEKIWILSAGQAIHWMQESLNIYFPSLIEWISAIGAVAIGVLLFELFKKLFNSKVSPASEN